MEQNKDIFPDKNNFPDNPYNQYYQEYIRDPEKEKKEVSKPKQVGSWYFAEYRPHGWFYRAVSGPFYMLSALKRIKQSIWDS